MGDLWEMLTVATQPDFPRKENQRLNQLILFSEYKLRINRLIINE